MAIYLLAAAGIFTLFLYRRGLMVTKSITALLFLFRPGKGQDQASLNSCSGWVSHMCRFQKEGIYVFSLNLQLSKGDVAISLLDREKQELLHLNQRLRTGYVELKQSGGYRLLWEFKNATGSCELRWEQEHKKQDRLSK